MNKLAHGYNSSTWDAKTKEFNRFEFGLLIKTHISLSYRVKTAVPKIKTPSIYKEINMFIHVTPLLVAVSTVCP